MLASEESREGESSHARFGCEGGVSDGSAYHKLAGTHSASKRLRVCLLSISF